LRETYEEIGLSPENARILGELDEAFTVSSAYLITPVVAEIVYPYPFSINEEEIEELIEIPLEAFLERDHWREETYSHGGKKVLGYRFEYEGRIIWGATARIMRQFLDLLFVSSMRLFCGRRHSNRPFHGRGENPLYYYNPFHSSGYSPWPPLVNLNANK
jgi:hypothetical protein